MLIGIHTSKIRHTFNNETQIQHMQHHTVNAVAKNDRGCKQKSLLATRNMSETGRFEVRS